MTYRKPADCSTTPKTKRQPWPAAESLGVAVLQLLRKKEEKLNHPYFLGATTETGWVRTGEVRPSGANWQQTTTAIKRLVKAGFVDAVPYQSILMSGPRATSRMYRINTRGKEFLDSLT